MKKLDHNKTREILEKLSIKLGRDKDKVVKKYIKHRPVNLIFAKIDIGAPLPNLWCPQNKSEKKIRDVYENIVTFNTHKYSHANKCKDGLFIRDYFLPLIKTFFKKENIKSFYAVGDWYSKDFDTHALEFDLNDMPKKIMDFHGFETYYFPEDLSWLLVNTHEQFWFLAGKKGFVDRFKKIYKEHQKYSADLRYLD